jgi:hypothetical protein
METNIYKISRDLFMVWISAGRIRDTERKIMGLENFKYLVIDPGRMTYLDSVPKSRVEILAESDEKIPVKGQTRRELKENRPELFIQPLQRTVESAQWFSTILETSRMGDKFAPLNRPDKMIRGFTVPVIESLGLGKPVEGRVDLNGVKTVGIKIQPLGSRDFRRIENLFPVFIVPTRCSNPPLC